VLEQYLVEEYPKYGIDNTPIQSEKNPRYLNNVPLKWYVAKQLTKPVAKTGTSKPSLIARTLGFTYEIKYCLTR
jgi:hypothetical protein